MSKLDEFTEVLDRFGKLTAMVVGASIFAPVVTAASGLAPPWPPGLAFMASILMLLTLALTFHFLTTRRGRFSVILVAGAIAFVLAAAVHVYLFSTFTDAAPRTGARLILGCEWTNDAIVVAGEFGTDPADQCPGNYRSLLENADGDPFAIWTAASISRIAYLLSVTWLSLFATLAFVIGSFVIWYRRPAA